MRAVFFGERDSTFSRLHLAQLARYADIVLWVTGTKNESAGSRHPFLSRRDWMERMWARLEFELKVVRAFRKPARPLLNADYPMYAARRGDPALIEIIARAAPELMVSAGYRFLLSEAILQLPRSGALNCHPSLLPRYAGSNPWFWILRNGERVSGVTIHRMTAEADAGDIVAQQAFTIRPEMNHQALYNESSIRSARLLQKVLGDLKANTAASRPQDLSHYQFFRSPRDADYRIDWNCSAAEIKNLTRAALPAPGAWTMLGGRRITVRRASVVTAPRGTPGQVTAANWNGMTVSCGSDALLIHAVECAGEEYDSKRAVRVLGIRAGDCCA